MEAEKEKEQRGKSAAAAKTKSAHIWPEWSMLPEMQLAKTISTPHAPFYIYFMLCLFDLKLVGRLGSGLSSGRANINISSQ